MQHRKIIYCIKNFFLTLPSTYNYINIHKTLSLQKFEHSDVDIIECQQISLEFLHRICLLIFPLLPFLLKDCVPYFHQTVIVSPNDSPSKTMKNAFYFI